MGNASNKHGGHGATKMRQQVKLIVVGNNSNSLKTKFLFTYIDGDKERDYIPSVFDNTQVEVEFKNTLVEIGLWDSSGQEEFDRLRPLTYAQTGKVSRHGDVAAKTGLLTLSALDVVLIIYNRLDEKSFASIRDLWVPELYHHIPAVPIIILECEGEDRGTSVLFEHAQALQADPNILAFAVEKANLKDHASIKKIINEKALEAVEFSLKSGFADEYRKIDETIREQYGAELKRLKGEADAASKAKDEGAKRKNEKYQELLAKVNAEIRQQTMKVKREVYAKHFGWKY